MYKDLTQPANVGHLLMALSVDAFMPRKQFYQRLSVLTGSIKSAKKCKGTNELFLPGEREVLTKRKRKEAGITLDEATLKELRSLANQLAVD